MSTGRSDSKRTSISFCVTCRNRLWQVKETLRANLKQIGDGHNICLVDFGSSDGLSEWIWSGFEKDIRDKRLTFFEVRNEVRWSMSRAKNLAHRMATGNYLFSLDADNWIVSEDIGQIEQAAEQGISCHQWSGSWADGSCGRLGVPRDLFLTLGGYDEALLPMGGEDLDLIQRILKAGGNLIRLSPPVILALDNTDEDRMSEVGKLNASSTDSAQIINNYNLSMSKIKLELEGPRRLGGYASFVGLLNGELVLIDGFNRVSRIEKQSRPA